MTALLAQLSELFTAILQWSGDVANTITGNPILLIPVGLSIVGVGVGLFKRMFSA